MHSFCHFKEKADAIASRSKENDHDTSLNLAEQVNSLQKKLEDLENQNKTLQEKLENVRIPLMHIVLLECAYVDMYVRMYVAIPTYHVCVILCIYYFYLIGWLLPTYSYYLQKEVF